MATDAGVILHVSPWHCYQSLPKLWVLFGVCLAMSWSNWTSHLKHFVSVHFLWCNFVFLISLKSIHSSQSFLDHGGLEPIPADSGWVVKPCTGGQSITRLPEIETTIPAGIHNSCQFITNKPNVHVFVQWQEAGVPWQNTGITWKLYCFIQKLTEFSFCGCR